MSPREHKKLCVALERVFQALRGLDLEQKLRVLRAVLAFYEPQPPAAAEEGKA